MPNKTRRYRGENASLDACRQGGPIDARGWAVALDEFRAEAIAPGAALAR